MDQQEMNNNLIISFINALPLGTLITLLGIAGAVYGLVTGQLDALQFNAAIAGAGVGGATIGAVRNQAGKGLRK